MLRNHSGAVVLGGALECGCVLAWREWDRTTGAGDLGFVFGLSRWFSGRWSAAGIIGRLGTRLTSSALREGLGHSRKRHRLVYIAVSLVLSAQDATQHIVVSEC